MNRIETGTTGERWVRCLVFVGLCVVFGAWFAYDGWVSYPAKNLQWAVQELPPRPPDAPKITTNPNVTGKNILPILRKVADPKVTLTRSQVIGLLGNPAYQNNETNELYFVGPAAVVQVRLAGDRVVDAKVKESHEHSEADINNQKRLSVILAVVAVIALVQFVRIISTRVVLDDEGYNFNGRLVTWDAMTGLNSDRYHEKGWVDLEYKDGEETVTLRIDNYKVRAFKEIVNAICERKGFPNPLHEPEGPEEPEELQTPPPVEPPEDSPPQG
jgi:hypothetical protein